MTFELPRRKRQAYDENRARISDLIEMENRIMSAIEDAVAELQSAIENANARFQGTGELEQALADERAKYDALVAAEDAEDVQQNADLQAARSATDEALAQVNEVTDTLSGLTDKVNQLGTTVAEAPAPSETPVEEPSSPADDTETTEQPAETPVEAPSETPAEQPADTATETEAPADKPISPADQQPQPGNASPVDASGGSTPAATDPDPTSTANMTPNL